METFKGLLNPLRCLDIEEIPGRAPATPTYEQLIAYMVGCDEDASVQAMTARYKQIIPTGLVLFVAPVTVPYVLDKLFLPLRHAIAAYMIHNHLGVIAQAGYVAEMVAILWLEMAEFRINDRPISQEQLKKLYGRTFERMGQDQRVKVLDAFNLIDSDAVAAFDGVRDMRRKYLHWLSHPHDTISADARTAFAHAASLVQSALGLGVSDGKVTFNPLFDIWMNKYLRAAAEAGSASSTGSSNEPAS